MNCYLQDYFLSKLYNKDLIHWSLFYVSYFTDYSFVKISFITIISTKCTFAKSNFEYLNIIKNLSLHQFLVKKIYQFLDKLVVVMCYIGCFTHLDFPR